MAYGNRQRFDRKAQLLAEGRAKAHLKEAQVFMDLIREEVFSNAYTDLEATFGTQEEHTLEFIHKGLAGSLNFIDKRFAKSYLERVTKSFAMPGTKYVTLKQSLERAGEHEEGLAKAVRDEAVDLLAQYAKDIMGLDDDRVREWVNALIEKPIMAPAALIDDARKRWK